MHEVLVNSLGGLSLPRKSVVRLTDRPDMTLDVYRGRKTTMQHIQFEILLVFLASVEKTHPAFLFCKQEYSFVQYPNLIFLSSAWYKNALNTPGVIYQFCRVKSLILLDLNELKNSLHLIFFAYCPMLH